MFERLECFDKPVIAAIHGAALGGGLNLRWAVICELSQKLRNSVCQNCSLDLIPGFAGTQRLPRYVGMPKAAEMFLQVIRFQVKKRFSWISK